LLQYMYMCTPLLFTKRTLSLRQLSRSNFSSTSLESVSTQVAMVSTTFSSDILPAPTSSKLYLVVGALLLSEEL
jgi:hypothetical protein